MGLVCSVLGTTTSTAATTWKALKAPKDQGRWKWRALQLKAFSHKNSHSQQSGERRVASGVSPQKDERVSGIPLFQLRNVKSAVYNLVAYSICQLCQQGALFPWTLSWLFQPLCLVSNYVLLIKHCAHVVAIDAPDSRTCWPALSTVQCLMYHVPCPMSNVQRSPPAPFPLCVCCSALALISPRLGT